LTLKTTHDSEGQEDGFHSVKASRQLPYRVIGKRRPLGSLLLQILVLLQVSVEPGPRPAPVAFERGNGASRDFRNLLVVQPAIESVFHELPESFVEACQFVDRIMKKEEIERTLFGGDLHLTKRHACLISAALVGSL